MVKHGQYRALVGALVWALCAGAAAAQVTACRQALALGLDVSASVDRAEYRLQLDGLAAALLAPDVAERILVQPEVPVSIYVFEWSGPGVQRTISPWTAITGKEALHAVADRLRGYQRTNIGDSVDQSTAINPAIAHGIKAIRERSHCWKRTIDISGDGTHNTGGDPREQRAALAHDAITVNGLVIGVDSPRGGDIRQLEIGELSSYYNAFVIFGPGAFVETALGFADFERAMRRKLLRELQGPVFGAITPSADVAGPRQ
ncbi:MAG: DUF1194 domain-containing protein [Pseudomonadota bacterium]